MSALTWLQDTTLLSPLFDFVFYYPLFMAWMWMIGGLWYYLYSERKDSADPDFEPVLKAHPKVSILVPCFNEEANVEEVVAALDRIHYSDFEIICINDGSKDRTGELLDEMLSRYPRLRVIHQNSNQGKAVALYEELVRIAPHEMDAVSILAELYFERGAWKEAAPLHGRLVKVAALRKDPPRAAVGHRNAHAGTSLWPRRARSGPGLRGAWSRQ